MKKFMLLMILGVILVGVALTLFPSAAPMLLTLGFLTVLSTALTLALQIPSVANRTRFLFSELAAGCQRMALLCTSGSLAFLSLVSPNRDRTDKQFLIGVAMSRILYLILSCII